MEVFASVGAEAREIFSDGDGMRPEMRAKRLDILREDVRDLVDLTAGRMKVSHIGGALLAQLCVFFFCEGRVEASAPPFLLSLFLVSNTCALVYMLLAVWLSMHASVVSRSFGARLLTRFVRPPMPSLSRTSAPRCLLEDFLTQRDEQGERALPSEEPEGAGGPCATGEPSSPGVSADAGAGDSGSGGGWPQHLSQREDQGAYAGASPADAVDAPTSASPGPTGRDGTWRRPGVAARTLHAQLFRRLQGKWLCFDACCGVSMFLGANQTLQGLAYYAIARTLAEGRSGAAGCAMLLILQAAAAALAILDIAGVRRSCVLLIQALGAAPALLAAVAVAFAPRTPEGLLDPDAHYGGSFSYVVFGSQVVWLEALLGVAAPSADGSSAPLFRSAPFLDVFGETCDPTEERGPLPETRTQLAAGGEQVAVAEHALAFAEAAIARWEAVPEDCLSDEQRWTLHGFAVDAGMWARTLRGELAWHRAVGIDALEHDGADALPQDREDPLAPWWLAGPFKTADGSLCYYGDGRVWEEPMDRPVLTLEDVGDMVRALEEAVRGLLGTRPEPPLDPHIFATHVAGDIVEVAERVAPALQAGRRSCLAIFQRVYRCSVLLGRRLSRVWVAASAAASGAGIEQVAAALASTAATEVEMSEPLELPLLQQRADAPAPSHRGGPPPPLPWQVLRCVTRVLQVAWGLTGTMALLRELGVFDQVRDGAVRDVAAPQLGVFDQVRDGAVRDVAAPQLGVFDQVRDGAVRDVAAPQGNATTQAPDTRRPIAFEPLRVKWPFGDVGFDPVAMSCTSAGVLLTNAFHHNYEAKMPAEDAGPVLLQSYQQPVQSYQQPVPDAEFCMPRKLLKDVPRLCLSGSLNKQELTLRPMADNIGFRDMGERKRDIYIVGKQWLRVAGTMFACPKQATGLDQLVLLDDSGNLEYAASEYDVCLLLVGWDGEKLPVAMIKFSIDDGRQEYDGRGGYRYGYRFDTNVFSIAIERAVVDPQFALRVQHDGPVLGMHFSPRPSLPLWVLLPGGRMETWELGPVRASPPVLPFRLMLQPQLWSNTATPAQEEDSTFEVRAACEDTAGRLLVLGVERRRSGAEERAQLIRSVIPMPS